MFGKKAAAPSRVYAYGAKAPVDGAADQVLEQIRLGHKYRNALVDLERKRREKVREVMLAHCPDVLNLDQEIEHARQQLTTLRDEISTRNRQERKRTGSKQERDRIAELRKQIKELSGNRKELSPYGRPDVKKAIESVEEATLVEKKRLRATCGLYWGNYLAIEQGMLPARNSPAPPQFRSWCGNGKVAVQVQGGMSVHEAFGKHPCLRIEPVPEDAWEKGQAKAKCRTNVWVRIGTDESSKPIWAIVPITMHRPLPPDGRIKWIYLLVKRTGTTNDWTVQFVVAEKDREKSQPGQGAVAIDFGWRVLANGLRVACWVDNEGKLGQLVLPTKDMDRWAKADELRSIRDRNHNAAKATLEDWLSKLEERPEWLSQAIKGRTKWRDPRRMLRLLSVWRTNRISGDRKVFSAIADWSLEDRRLFQWESHQRAKAIRWRDDLYRNFAASMRRYDTVYIGKINWAQVGRKPPPESEPVKVAGKKHRQIAAPGRLSQVLREACNVVEVNPTDATHECHRCGHVNDFDAATGLTQSCSSCGKSWDQDENAARILLARGLKRKK